MDEWRGARAVEWGGLENRCAERYPGFESLPLRHVLRYEYEVNGQRYESSAFDLLDTRYAEREKAEKICSRYRIGETYSCWYDPLEPKTAVLLRGNPLAYWLLLLPVAFLAIGIGGLAYTIWQFSVSRERQSAIAQRAPGKAFTFITTDDRDWIRATERMIGSSITQEKVDGFELGAGAPASQGRGNGRGQRSGGRPGGSGNGSRNRPSRGRSSQAKRGRSNTRPSAAR